MRSEVWQPVAFGAALFAIGRLACWLVALAVGAA